MSASSVHGPAYPAWLIGATRLLSATCMFSAMAAVLRFEMTTLTGRLLTVGSVMVAFSGQLFAHQAAKPQPRAWTLALLPVILIGVAGLGISWVAALT